MTIEEYIDELISNSKDITLSRVLSHVEKEFSVKLNAEQKRLIKDKIVAKSESKSRNTVRLVGLCIVALSLLPLAFGIYFVFNSSQADPNKSAAKSLIITSIGLLAVGLGIAIKGKHPLLK